MPDPVHNQSGVSSVSPDATNTLIAPHAQPSTLNSLHSASSYLSVVYSSLSFEYIRTVTFMACSSWNSS